MKNFHKIASNIDVIPLMHAITRQQELWNAHRFRTTFPNTPHAEAEDIWLRYSRHDLVSSADGIGSVINDQEPVFYPAWDALPQARPIIFDLMRRMEAYQLGRVLVTKLRPGKRILAHTDVVGSYVNGPGIARYHIALQGLPGSLYRTGGETVCMLTGECWWFNAREEHEVLNNSADDRVHLIVDVVTR